MRKSTVRMATGTTVGAAALTLGLLAGPALAANGGGGAGSCDGTGEPVATQARDGSGGAQAQGRGGAGVQRGSGAQVQAGAGGGAQVQAGAGGTRASDGTGASAQQRQAREATGDCTTCTALEMGDLSEDQEADLVYMVQEEKLAHDLYVAFAEQYDVAKFERIARSETQHMTAVRTLLERYGVEDPTITLEAGEFVDGELAALYDDLLAQGEASLDDALAAARAVEKDDIDELDEALDGLTAPDVTQVYENLLTASERHLSAFGG